MACTIHYPDNPARGGRQIVIFAVPGGGYSRHYFDMRFEGHDGYSEAEYHTARGTIFVTIDHLGVGDSSLDLVAELTIERAADGYASCVRQIAGLLQAGQAAPELPAVSAPFLVGIGQSLGGGVTIVTQSRHGVFDAVAILGKSALHTVLPQPTFEKFAVQKSIFQFTRTTPLDELHVDAEAAKVPDFLYPFHWPEEPDDIVAHDMAGGYPRSGETASVPRYGSATTPVYAVTMMSPAFLTPDAARITVPVLIAGGERDVMPDVRREPTAFISSDDISVFVVPRMAHMHNFAPTRRRLWERVADWAAMQANCER